MKISMAVLVVNLCVTETAIQRHCVDFSRVAFMTSMQKFYLRDRHLSHELNTCTVSKDSYAPKDPVKSIVYTSAHIADLSCWIILVF